jgi:alcohol dehydrogenase class IV
MSSRMKTAGGRTMRFEFATATRIIFGAGTLTEIGSLAAQMGQRALVITTHHAGRAAPLFTQLGAAKVEYVTFEIDHEPTTGIVVKAVQLAREHGCDLVIGFGGGSVIDTGKAVAALLTNPGEVLDYLEVIGRGQTLTRLSAPYIAMPTTAGTGSEVTRNAVLASPEHKVKVSMRSAFMLPTVALIDPELMRSLPPDVTASTGLDAMTQVIEPFVSKQANPVTDALCREAIWRAGRSLLRAYNQGNDVVAREDMALVALFGGLALANAKLGAVHGFAGPLGGMFDAPHGAVCAALLPHVMAKNVEVLRERQPDSSALRRFEEVAQILTCDQAATADDGVTWMHALNAAMHVPGLAAYGLGEDHFDELIDKSSRASSMKGNPIALTADDMRDILRRAL